MIEYKFLIQLLLVIRILGEVQQKIEFLKCTDRKNGTKK